MPFYIIFYSTQFKIEFNSLHYSCIRNHLLYTYYLPITMIGHCDRNIKNMVLTQDAYNLVGGTENEMNK